MKVFIACSQWWEQFAILGVFSSVEKANEANNIYRENNKHSLMATDGTFIVTEFELDILQLEDY